MLGLRPLQPIPLAVVRKGIAQMASLPAADGDRKQAESA